MFSVVHAEHRSPWYNLAFDEALVRSEPDEPTLWLWRNPPCVVLGRGQRVEREVDLPACSAAGVPVLRRGSGGGTVYHDLGNLNITLVLPGKAEPLTMLRAVLLRLLGRVGLTPGLTERGVFLGTDKLCGFAALYTARATLAHATLLCWTPLDDVTRFLSAAPAEAHPLDSRRGPVTSLAAHGITARAEPMVLDALREILGKPWHRAPNRRELEQQRRLVHTRFGFAPWHRCGNTRTTKEDSWTQQAASISTG